MIKPSDVKDIKARLVTIEEAETKIDDAIRRAIADRASMVSVEFTNQDIANEIAQRYRAVGWEHAIKVVDTGSDRTYSPRDGWTVRISLEGL